MSIVDFQAIYSALLREVGGGGEGESSTARAEERNISKI